MEKMLLAYGNGKGMYKLCTKTRCPAHSMNICLLVELIRLVPWDFVVDYIFDSWYVDASCQYVRCNRDSSNTTEELLVVLTIFSVHSTVNQYRRHVSVS